MPYKDPKKAKEYAARHYQKNKAKYRAANKRWIENHPDEFLAIQRNYLATEKGKQSVMKKQKKFQGSEKSNTRYRRSNLKRAYGLTLEQYDVMFDEQNGVCAICNEQATDGRRLAVDHDHKTGKIRGLLCMNCNVGIGNLQDDITILRNAVDYLSPA